MVQNMQAISKVPKNETMFRNPQSANEFPYWGFFSRKELLQEKGKLLMMDVDFKRRCSLGCPECFRKQNPLDDDVKKDLRPEFLIGQIIGAKKLGLRSIKVCGAGEPFENAGFLEFLRTMSGEGIGVAIFTKGHVLGSDEKARRHFGHLGFGNALDLCRELYSLKTSIMLSFSSFTPEIADMRVGGVQGYSKERDAALMNLVEVGFNSQSPTRLMLCANPVMKDNYGEALSIYTFARERNIYPLLTALMTCGKQVDREFLSLHDISAEQKIALWTDIYSYNIRTGLQTLEQIDAEGISPMPGTHPCNQIATGMYLTAKGSVTLCTGYGIKIADIEEGLDDAWRRVRDFWENVSRGKDCGYNCSCPPKDGITIPGNLYSEVLRRLKFGIGGG